MDAFLNLAVFILAFYLITLYAGWPDRRRTKDPDNIEPRSAGKRVA